MDERDYLLFREERGHNGKYECGVRIQIYGTGLDKDDFKGSKNLRLAGYDAVDKIRDEILRLIRSNDDERKQKVNSVKQSLMDCFDGPIYVEEIPNGYCSSWCCEDKHWLKVTTEIGHFVIGWRSSVIQLEWNETIVSQTSKDLFPDNHQSNSTRSVHVDTYKQAKEYIKTIIAAKESDETDKE